MEVNLPRLAGASNQSSVRLPGQVRIYTFQSEGEMVDVTEHRKGATTRFPRNAIQIPWLHIPMESATENCHGCFYGWLELMHHVLVNASKGHQTAVAHKFFTERSITTA